MNAPPERAAGTRPRVTVVMPTFNQATFISRALESLFAQTMSDWELIVVDDGSTDETANIVGGALRDERIRYERLRENRGLGAALNVGLGMATADLIAYLPSDDLFHPAHLASLLETLERDPEAILAYSGVRHHYNRFTDGAVPGHPLQLVQVLHARTVDRWVEREELVTDDLDRMFWKQLRRRGRSVGTGRVTCEWLDHPAQLHKVIRETTGGINVYRARYSVREPIRMHSSVGSLVDEVELYRAYRERPDTAPAPDGLKILLVGELAYNGERILALEERGHRLFGLWLPEPMWFNTVGPVPFGHVTDVALDGWVDSVRRIKPDVIYALLNWQTVRFAHRVLLENPGIPFVWHFKEGPFICIERGIWRELRELQTRSDGQIYCSPEMRDWFETALPGSTRHENVLVMDGDLPKRDWFDSDPAARVSDTEIHTVVPGRPIGLHPPDVQALADRGIHLHFYGEYTHELWREWIDTTSRRARGYLHLHPNVNQDRWVDEFSRYDAGWLHIFRSANGGEIRCATWDDLNIPARLPLLAAAGLPMIQQSNRDALVATQNLTRGMDIGVFFEDADELRAQLGDRARMRMLRDSVRRHRDVFTFDHHADRLVAFFRHVIQGASARRRASA